MKARLPDREGYVERDGVRVFWELHGRGEPTLLLLPTWSIIHSRHWKAQVPYLARHFRIVTFDGRGNGRSDRPTDPRAYREQEFAADALAVMDATETERAVLVSLSIGAVRALLLAAEHPERVDGAVFIGPTVPLSPQHPERLQHSFFDPLDTDEGWAKYNLHYWRKDYRSFLEFFFSRMFTEPHSTKQIEDCVGWGLETTPEALIAATTAPNLPDSARTLELCSRVRCPVLVVHGDQDAISPHARGERLACETGGTLVTLEGSGHGPHARDPVKVNLLLREFAERVRPPRPRARAWRRGRARPKRALYVSSPIGLGHARRDVQIARELRRVVPGLEIDWLAQHPVTRVLEAEGERVHPASALLANESSHIESESAEHDLHCFQAWRRMDEILVANFMVFHDLVREEAYDVWIGDEAWELDYYLHENPELKRAAYVWLTDFVGWLPMPDGGEREAFLTADYNAEMIEHIARHPRVRDRALFVGSADDIVPERFGPGLPGIREWTEAHFTFPGYITGFERDRLGRREELRGQLGYRPDERVCVVTVGGSGVGGHLLRRVVASFPEAKRRVPDLRMIVVTGPRIDPRGFEPRDGLEVRAYVHELYRHLAACDLAVVQGGLTTAMELTAAKTPFLYFPLRHHFEQSFHVHHRLRRYGAGRRMEFETATPELIAQAIAEEIGREVSYREVETDGARRAAETIAELL
ncbi:MAG TPA: alpha/beta fold hydrolase [Longimicrobiales bacterium]|nr:alpha/beta fold hydrolase [Longimicrobiales bacterium]